MKIVEHIFAVLGFVYWVSIMIDLWFKFDERIKKIYKKYWYSTWIYQEWEYCHVQKMFKTKWQSFDWTQLCNIETMIHYHKRFQTNKHTAYYLQLIAELKLQIEKKWTKKAGSDYEDDIKNDVDEGFDPDVDIQK